MTLRQLLILPGLLALFILPAVAQNDQEEEPKVVDFRADLMRPITVGDSSVLNLIGNVVLHHNGAVITCDSAIRYSDKRMDCFKRVVINQKTTYVYGDRAEYDGTINTARVYAPIVKMVDEDAVLYTYNFSFNTLDEIGTYWGGGTMTQGDNLMESRRGYYYVNDRLFVGVDDVELRNPDYQMQSDSVAYNLDHEIADFWTRSYIWNEKEEILSAERGRYYHLTTDYYFTRDSYVLTKDQEIWADSIDYNSTTENAILRRDVQIRDEDQKVLAFGDYGQYWGLPQHGMLTRDPSLVSFDPEQDSLFMRADTMFLYTFPYEMDFPEGVPLADLANPPVVEQDEDVDTDDMEIELLGTDDLMTINDFPMDGDAESLLDEMYEDLFEEIMEEGPPDDGDDGQQEREGDSVDDDPAEDGGSASDTEPEISGEDSAEVESEAAEQPQQSPPATSLSKKEQKKLDRQRRQQEKAAGRIKDEVSAPGKNDRIEHQPSYSIEGQEVPQERTADGIDSIPVPVQEPGQGDLGMKPGSPVTEQVFPDSPQLPGIAESQPGTDTVGQQPEEIPEPVYTLTIDDLFERDSTGVLVIPRDSLGLPLIQLDSLENPILRADEDGRPIIPHDSLGQPIIPADTLGRPLLRVTLVDSLGNIIPQPARLTESYQYTIDDLFERDSTGVLMIPHDSLGVPLFEIDQFENPVLRADDDGRPIIPRDSLGEPVIPTDQSGRPLVKVTVVDSLGNVVAQPTRTVTEEEPQRDSLQRVVHGFRNVRIFRADFQAVCDSIVGFSRDSTLHLYIDPVMWNEDNQIVSDVMDIYTKNKQLDRAVFTGSPFMASEVDRLRYNQIKGRVMEAFFRDNEIYRHDVNGNVQTYYYMEDEETGDIMAFLVIESADATFLIEDKQMDEIIYRNRPDFIGYPMDKIPLTQDQFLPGFKWEANRRPTRQSVFNRTIRDSQRQEYEERPHPEFPLTDSIHTDKDRMISNGIWTERNDTLSPIAVEFLRSLELEDF